MDNLKATPLLDEHKNLGARLAPFGGWLMPIQYDGIIVEHNWTRAAASLFDICHMGEFIISGRPLESGLDRIVTINLEKMESGTCRYGFMLNENGGVIDDVIVYRLGSDKWMLVVNASTKDNDFAHVEHNLSQDAALEDVSDKIGKLDLQGPMTQEILRNYIGDTALELKYYSFRYFSREGGSNIISRTGYTGELGFELYVDRDKVVDLWKELLHDERIRPAGLGARDTLRLEMGYPLYGQDIDERITPLEAGFEKYLDFNKDFIGRDALIKEKTTGIEKRLAYFLTDSRRSPRHNYKIMTDSKEIGVVTSGTFSPSLSRGIAMGYIERRYNKEGQLVVLSSGKAEINAIITDKPFYKQGSARR